MSTVKAPRDGPPVLRSMLVVDAHAPSRLQAEAVLVAIRCGPVMTASRIQEARALMACVRFDLVVLDVRLTPGSAAPDGVPVLVAAAEAGTPVIVHSSVDPAQLRAITHAPTHACLPKPAPDEVLRAAAVRALALEAP